MKKLDFPKVNDLAILRKIRDTPDFGAHTEIVKVYSKMRRKYINYGVNQGTPWLCCGYEIKKDLKDKLENHYSKPRKELKYINEIRDNKSPDVCPMCGSPGTGTLDHYLPQSNYPEWIIYSKNLIPACDCNSKRSTTVKGNTPHKKVIHPYFDKGLHKRIVYSEFSGNLEEPTIKIVPLPNNMLHPDTIQFHIDVVINRSRVFSWMRKHWQKMKKNPRSIITLIPRNNPTISMIQLERYLNEMREDEDECYGTPNNWSSMFIHGIISSDDAKQWLLNRHNGIVTGVINPLI